MSTDWQLLLWQVLNASHPTEAPEQLKELEKRLETLVTSMVEAKSQARFVQLRGLGARIHHVNPGLVENIERINAVVTRVYLPNRNRLTIMEPHDVVVAKLSLA